MCDIGISVRDHQDQIKILLEEIPELKKIAECKVGFDMFDEDLEKIKDTFLTNLQTVAGNEAGTKVASQAFLTIAKRKQAAAGGLSRSDK